MFGRDLTTPLDFVSLHDQIKVFEKNYFMPHLIYTLYFNMTIPLQLIDKKYLKLAAVFKNYIDYF